MSTNKTATVGQYAKLRQGLAEIMGKSAKVKVQGKEVKISEILSSLDQLLTAAQAVEPAKAAYHHAVAIAKNHRDQARPSVSALVDQLRATLLPGELAACGLTPRKTARVLSADERTAKMVKLRATREANQTRGERQRREEAAKAVITAAFATNGSGHAPSAQSPPAAREGNGAA